MEIGDNGVRGTHAARHVNKGHNHELVNATHRFLDMAESYVKGNQIKLKFATRIFRAQVISIVCLFVCFSACASIADLITNPILLLMFSISQSGQNRLCFSF